MKTIFSLLVGLLLMAGVSVDGVNAQSTARTVNGGVVNGKAVSLPKPEYPKELRSAGIEGVVAVNITIDETGNVIFAEADLNDQRVRRTEDGTVLESAVLDAGLRAAAENAARQAKFAPTLLENSPVQVKGKIVYNFVVGSPDPAGGPKTLIGGVLNGKATSLPAPEYPAAAKAVRAGGAVSVQVVVDEDGNVVSASVMSGHPLLRAAAETAALAAKFSPTTLSGQPVRIAGVLTYNFVP